jgi:hypothetical protein
MLRVVSRPIAGLVVTLIATAAAQEGHLVRAGLAALARDRAFRRA